MPHQPAEDRRLMVSAGPSTYKIRLDIEHALDCFNTLKGDERLVESVVKSILRDLLTYLSNFDGTNRLLISRCVRVNDDGYETLLEGDAGDVSDLKGAQHAGAGSLDAIE